MKKQMKRYLEIVLLITTIIGLFAPFVFGIVPVDVVYPKDMNILTLMGLTIPVSLLGAMLLVLLFQGRMGERFLKGLTLFSLLLYLVIFGHYVYMLTSETLSIEMDDFLMCALILGASLALVLLSLIFSKVKIQKLNNIFLGTITLPFILHMPFIDTEIRDTNYGGLLIESTFILLYVIAVFGIFYKRKKG